MAVLIVLLVTTSATATSPQRPGVTLKIVAAENFWGGLVAQLGGSHVQVISIVSDPNADPHEYESNTTDARAVATANYVILNGVGYDDWANKLLSASPNAHRKVLTVGNLFDKHDGDNPHLWYNPEYVFQAIDQISANLQSLDPGDAAYFRRQLQIVESSFDQYRKLISYVQTHFAGTKVASTESIFQYMASYLKLDLVTPYPFMQAVAEGNDPPVASVATFQRQIQSRDFQVLVYNVQTVTSVTTTIKEEVAQKNIPIVGISETVQPPIDTFQEWMDGELSSLINALNAKALGA